MRSTAATMHFDAGETTDVLMIPPIGPRRRLAFGRRTAHPTDSDQVVIL
jgi:hypothetical protein